MPKHIKSHLALPPYSVIHGYSIYWVVSNLTREETHESGAQMKTLQLTSSIKTATKARNPGALIPSSFVTNTFGRPLCWALATTPLDTASSSASSTASARRCFIKLGGSWPPVYMMADCTHNPQNTNLSRIPHRIPNLPLEIPSKNCSKIHNSNINEVLQRAMQSEYVAVDSLQQFRSGSVNCVDSSTSRVSKTWWGRGEKAREGERERERPGLAHRGGIPTLDRAPPGPLFLEAPAQTFERGFFLLASPKVSFHRLVELCWKDSI